MFRNPGFRLSLLAVYGLYLLVFAPAAPAGVRQAAQLPEKPEQHQHQRGHEMNVPSGVSDKCEPTFTYEEGQTESFN